MKTDKDYEKELTKLRRQQLDTGMRLREEIKNLENKVTDMNVVIETLQQALGRAKVSLGFTDKEYVFNHSAKWASKWSLKDYDYNI